jgi:spore maturation protein CgeB
MSDALPRSRRILYVGDVAPATTSGLRFRSLERLGQQVQSFDFSPYKPSSRARSWLQFHYPYGPLVARANSDLRKVVAAFRPDIVWFDKPLAYTRQTMDSIHSAGGQIVFYLQDAPFGPRNDGCWRQFKRVFRMADLHCLVRKADVTRYSAWGLPWIKCILSYDPRLHYPPPHAWSDADRDRGLSYIGHPYEQRPDFLVQLARDRQLPVFINGNYWRRTLSPEQQQYVTLGDFLAGDEYRSGIWRSKINLSFVTEENEEDIAHKAVEIAACAGFLLAVRTPGHREAFEEDREAVFFSSVEECADKARFYLNRPDLREAIAARGRERAVRSGYDNDTQLARILNRLDGKAD